MPPLKLTLRVQVPIYRLPIPADMRVQGLGFRVEALRVQVPNNHILTQNLYYNSKYKDLIIEYLDPLG